MRGDRTACTLWYTEALKNRLICTGDDRLAKRDQQELSANAVERITNVVHSLADDRVERGIDLAEPVRCDSCLQTKPSAGSALYGAYKLCNDCLLDFTLALASGRVSSVADYMTKRHDTEDRALVAPIALLVEDRERASMPVSTRETLEPA